MQSAAAAAAAGAVSCRVLLRRWRRIKKDEDINVRPIWAAKEEGEIRGRGGRFYA